MSPPYGIVTEQAMRRFFATVLIACLIFMPLRSLEASGNTLREIAGRPPAPALDLHDLDGRRHRLTDYRGRVVIVTFWASWCHECRYEMPSLQRAWERLRKAGVVMLAVNVDEAPEVVRAYGNRLGLTFPLLLDPDMTAYKDWPVLGVPATYVIDPQGRLNYEAVGARDWDSPAMTGRIEDLAVR
jgi:peroxiredoxin